MNPSFKSTALSFLLICATRALCHEDPGLGHLGSVLNSPETFIAPEWFLAQAGSAPLVASPTVGPKPVQAQSFEPFAPAVKLRWDSRFLYVENNGIPSHPMMVGITSWQQQVPIPQRYSGDNAWRFPLEPVPSPSPVSIKGRFLRGAIAIAANGIPIFNPQNNRGEVSAEIGELDKWGGHCGRADDYHYHAAPLHLESSVGKGKPIAYALDGYPILGLTETGGTSPSGLDAFNGHTHAALGYHYHASTKYPYVQGGFHGVVAEIEGQVDPQPRAQPVRDSLTALRGAKITSFEAVSSQTNKLGYELNGEKRAVVYTQNADGTYTFEFQNGRDGTSSQTYSPKAGGGGKPGGSPGRPEDRAPKRPGERPPDKPDQPGRSRENAPNPNAATPQPSSSQIKSSSFVLRSREIRDGGELPVEYSGDGPGSSPPLEWSDAPAGTKSYALAMHHLDPEGKTKWYWILYNIDPSVKALEKNSKGVGSLGANFKGQLGYEPPHSKGPGAKTYILTLYALSEPLAVPATPTKMDYDSLVSAVKGKVLASADLNVVYTRAGAGTEPPQNTNAQKPARGQAGNGQNGQKPAPPPKP